jgi:hypothetical protein
MFGESTKKFGWELDRPIEPIGWVPRIGEAKCERGLAGAPGIEFRYVGNVAHGTN